jgi:hypothetical protein
MVSETLAKWKSVLPELSDPEFNRNSFENLEKRSCWQKLQYRNRHNVIKKIAVQDKKTIVLRSEDTTDSFSSNNEKFLEDVELDKKIYSSSSE